MIGLIVHVQLDVEHGRQVDARREEKNTDSNEGTESIESHRRVPVFHKSLETVTNAAGEKFRVHGKSKMVC